MKTIWIGKIPDIFGYGMIVAGTSKKSCYDALKREYRKWAVNTPDTYGVMHNEDGKRMTRFEKAMEHWGGSVEEIVLNKIYYDNFQE